MNPALALFRAMAHGASQPRAWLACGGLALLSACSVATHDKLNPGEANELVSALAAAGIDADKNSPDGKTWSVDVAKSDLPAALDVLRSQGLPQERHTNVGEVFKKQGLVSTPTEERLRFIYAVSQELSDTLGHIDGVVLARVHVVLPANDPLSDKIRPSSASVFIKHRPDMNLETLQTAVKNLVMKGIEGLVYDNVSVTFLQVEKQVRPESQHMTKVLGVNASNQMLGSLMGSFAVVALLALAGLTALTMR
jgi:type III secretion protein J